MVIECTLRRLCEADRDDAYESRIPSQMKMERVTRLSIRRWYRLRNFWNFSSRFEIKRLECLA